MQQQKSIDLQISTKKTAQIVVVYVIVLIARQHAAQRDIVMANPSVRPSVCPMPPLCPKRMDYCRTFLTI